MIHSSFASCVSVEYLEGIVADPCMQQKSSEDVQNKPALMQAGKDKAGKHQQTPLTQTPTKASEHNSITGVILIAEQGEKVFRCSDTVLESSNQSDPIVDNTNTTFRAWSRRGGMVRNKIEAFRLIFGCSAHCARRFAPCVGEDADSERFRCHCLQGWHLHIGIGSIADGRVCLQGPRAVVMCFLLELADVS